jgi:hypothetical protein
VCSPRCVNKEANLGHDHKHGENQADTKADDDANQHPNVGNHYRDGTVDQRFNCNLSPSQLGSSRSNPPLSNFASSIAAGIEIEFLGGPGWGRTNDQPIMSRPL